MIASQRSLESLPCSQQQTRSSWSLLCNAGPPFRGYGGILSVPTALPLLKCSMASVISFIEGSSSNFALNGCWRMLRTVGSWTTQSVLKKYRKCSDQRLRGHVCKKPLSFCTVQGTLDPVSRAVHCHEAFLEASVVTYVWILLVLFVRLVHHSFWISRSLRWRMLQMRQKAVLPTGHNEWASWA